MLDKSKLLNVRLGINGSFTAGCPACIEKGHDSKRIHLSVLRDGRYSCGANQNDSEHSKRIWQLAGPKSEDIDYDEIEYKLVQEKIYDEKLIEKLIKSYDYFNKRNVPNFVLDQFECGIATDGMLKDRFVFFCRNFKGQLVGFAGRSIINADMKWKILGSKSRFIFCDQKISSIEIKERKYVVLVESIGCVLRHFEAGYKNVICLFGTSLSSSIFQYLISLSPNLILVATNNEKSEVGNKAAIKIKNKLDKFFNPDNVIIKLPNSKDFLDMDVESVKNWHKEINVS